MRPIAWFFALAILLWAGSASAQTRASRITMQDAYRNWRLVDPNLEADAANNPTGPTGPTAPSMSVRTERVAAEAAKYFAERKAYYDALAAEMRAAAKGMEPTAAVTFDKAEAAPAAVLAGVNIQAQLNAITSNLSAIPKNPDAGLLEFRHALERERAALTALKELPYASPTLPPATSNAHALEDYVDLLAEVTQEGAESGTLGEAWASYYRALAAGASATNISGVRSPAIRPRPAEPRPEPSDLVSNALNSVQPSVRETATSTAVAAPTPVPPLLQPVESTSSKPVAAQLATQPAAQPREKLSAVLAGKTSTATPAAAPTLVTPPTLTPPAVNSVTEHPTDHPDTVHPDTVHAEAVASGPIRSTAAANAPVTRYAGNWVYPTIGEHYHGAHPESVDLEMHSDNGHVTGRFRTKFRVPPGVTLDPIVEFTFEGDYQAARTQSFPFVTSDGAKGTLELIPATTFNLLEISFVTDTPAGGAPANSKDAKPNKITRGNFFLIRK